jgi:hypothetical protein
MDMAKLLNFVLSAHRMHRILPDPSHAYILRDAEIHSLTVPELGAI